MAVTTDPWAALADPARQALLARVARERSGVTTLARDLRISRLAAPARAALGPAGRRPHPGRHRMYAARRDGLAALCGFGCIP